MRPQYEAILPMENSSFKAFIPVKKEFNFPFHYHPEYELLYILSSKGIRYTGNQFENFEENDFVLLGPFLPHCWKNPVDHQGMASAIVIQWNADLLGDNWLEKKEFSAIKGLLQNSAKGIKFPVDVALKLKPQLLQLIEEPSSFEKMIRLVRILGELAAVNNFKMLCKEDVSNSYTTTDNERLNTIYQYLKEHYKEKITLDIMASLVHMAEESFSRFFSKLMKKSFFTFLNEYRINVACKLLVETDLLIAQICYQSGYESTSFFFRQFKKFKNCSPQYYRNTFKSAGGFSIPVVE